MQILDTSAFINEYHTDEDTASVPQVHEELEGEHAFRFDAEEGADVLMVKPALPYLDIVRDVREQSDKPVAAYNVSGEYAMLHAAAEKGWLDIEEVAHESLVSIKRAGADLIVTYFGETVAERL